MPDQSGGAGQACVRFISCLLFLILLTGGVFLGMFIFLPTSPHRAWLLPAGMGLVAAPWMFWILTCLYRCVVHRIVYSMNDGEERSMALPKQVATARQTTIMPTTAPLATVVEEQSKSPDGAAQKVRACNARDEEIGMGPQMGSLGMANGSSRYGGGSSSTSRESEMPLTLSMSS